MNSYNEPLEISAPIAWDLAARHCRRDPVTGATCACNHGVWQFLRIMGMAGTAAKRRSFYQAAITDFTRVNPAPRVLISGASDTAMLAQVAGAFQQAGIMPSISVVDVCETPLRLNQWYAGQQGLQIETVCSDILTYRSPTPFDLICTDSFISRFPHAVWSRLAAQWHALLAPGGWLLTTSRLRPATAPDCIRFLPEQVKAFSKEFMLEATVNHNCFGIEPEELADCAERYAQQQINYPLRSISEIETMLSGAGLALDAIQQLQGTKANKAGIDAPTISGGGEYLGIIAHRP
jgi:SAM-dependent methyltransferase